MSDINLEEMLLTWLVNYGAAALGVTLFVGALGAPLPGSLLVLAAGAFARQGVLEWQWAALAGLWGAVIGDTLSYGMGYWAKNWVERRFAHAATWQQAQAIFVKRGALAIYLTRFILTQVAIPVNWVAGSSGYPLGRFFAYDFAGEVTWILLYGGLGYTFGNQWELISQLLSDFGGLLVGVLIVLSGGYLLFRRYAAPVPHTAARSNVDPP